MKQETHKKLGSLTTAAMFRRLTDSHLDGALHASEVPYFTN